VLEAVGAPGAPSIQALATASASQAHATPAPFPFTTSAAMLAICEREGLSVSDVVLANELSARSREEVMAYLDRLRATMRACIEAGMNAEGILPGGLGVRRRAKALHERLCAQSTGPGAAFTMADPLRGMDWVDLFALAVNEENAAGRRVVTAPTNGAAGIVPAVLAYYERFIPGADDDGVRRFLLAATALIWGAGYSLWMYKRVVFGPVANPNVDKMEDVNRREFWLLMLMAALVLFMGIYPKFFTDLIQVSVEQLLTHVSQTKLK